MKIKNTNKGITLIALVITIVLMLILATVTVNVVIDGGLFENASDAKRNTEIASEKETIQKVTMIAKDKSKSGIITVDDIEKGLNKIVTEENGTTVMDNGDTIVVRYNKSNRYYEINNKGKVEGPKELIKEEYAGDITKGGQCDGNSLEKAFQITCIEDLVEFSIMSNGGNTLLGISSETFANKYVELTRTLDFRSIFSYNDHTTTTYGDLNRDGKIEDIKTELTRTDKGCIGFKGINNFQGYFDGNGEEIKGIYINTTKTLTNAGLFVSIINATIKNLGTTGTVISDMHAGGVVCSSDGKSKIDNCYSYVDVVSTQEGTTSYSAGGICAITSAESIVSNSYNKGSVEGNSGAGGIVGSFCGKIENCYNEGKITTNATASFSGAGGIAGFGHWCAGTKIIKNCYNNGPINSKKSGGGIVGNLSKAHTGEEYKFIVVNCYNLKNVNCNTDAGGIIGEAYVNNKTNIVNVEIINCYNSGEINGVNAVGRDFWKSCKTWSFKCKN